MSTQRFLFFVLNHVAKLHQQESLNSLVTISWLYLNPMNSFVVILVYASAIREEINPLME